MTFALIFCRSLSKLPVPLAPTAHFAATGSVLLYPGKVATYPGGLVISDTGHNRILLTDRLGNVKVSLFWCVCEFGQSRRA